MYEQPYRQYWRVLYPEYSRTQIDGALVRQVEDRRDVHRSL